MRPHVMEWDEAQHFSPDLLPKLAGLGLMGIQFAGRVRRLGDVGRGLLHLYRRAGARRPRRSRCRWRRTTACARRTSTCSATTRRRSAYLPRLVKGEVLGAWGLTEANAGSDAAAMRTTAVRQGDVLGPQRLEDVHHARRDRRRDGGDGGHRSSEGEPRHLRVRARARHARDARRQEREQARDARERHQRSGVPGLPHSRRRRCSATKGRGSSTRCRCSTPGGSGSRPCRSGSRRAPTKRHAPTRRSATSSASRSPRSRRSSGSWPTRRRGSRRRGC